MIIKCKYDELVNPKDLKPHPKNRNIHPKDQIERLSKILKYQGQRAPIIVSNLSGFLAKGHGTAEAAIMAGAKEVAVVYQDFEDSDQEYAFVQSDNAIAAWADLDLAAINADLKDIGPFDIDLLGIKDFVIEPADKYGDEDAIPELNRETKIGPGDLYQLGNHRLLCGDSTNKDQVERLMNGEKADMVFTDPPYNVGYEYETWDDQGSPEEYREFLIKVFDLASESLVTDCTVYIKNAPRNLPDFFPIMKGWLLNNLIVWPHSCQYHPPNRFSTNWEAICAFIRGKPIFNAKAQVQPVDTPIRLKGMVKLDGRIDDVWHDIPWLSAGAMMAKETIRKPGTNSKAHPCQMPIALPERAILFSSNEDAKVYDPFSGSGTTLIACEKTNRQCFGIELDPLYCTIIIERWEKFTGKKAEKIG